jgi:hypothetical protein
MEKRNKSPGARAGAGVGCTEYARNDACFYSTAKLHELTVSGTSILAPVRRKYLCIVNPVSGAGIAQGIMQRTVLPMLRQADIEYDLLGASTCL